MKTLIEKIHRLPLELRLWCIIPYTYQLQNKELLRDIRTYRTDMNILDNIYGVQYTDSILLYDLKRFCQFPLIHTVRNILVEEEINNIDINNLPKCFKIWKRHYSYQYSNNMDLYAQLFRFLTRQITISRKINFIFGLLTVLERTQFIEMYILNR
jgi:hypothetical protein